MDERRFSSAPSAGAYRIVQGWLGERYEPHDGGEVGTLIEVRDIMSISMPKLKYSLSVLFPKPCFR